jgi:uncharacterized membrane protein YbhN (UPF0104 family)
LIRKLLIPLLVSFIFFYLLFKLLSPEEIESLLKSLSFSILIPAFFLYTLSQVVRSVRWKVLIKDLSLWEVFTVNSANILMNNLLPARTGELSWFYYARKLGIDLKVSLWSFILGRLYDLLGLVFLFTLLYGLLSGLDGLILSLSVWVGVSLLIPYLRVLLPSKGKLKDFKNFLRRELTLALSFQLTLLSLLSFSFKALSLYILVKDLLKVDPLSFTFAFAGGELTSVLPVHGFMGYGTYEAGFLLPLKLLGIEVKEALKAGFLAHTFLLVSSAFWGLISIWFLHTPFRRPP